MQDIKIKADVYCSDIRTLTGRYYFPWKCRLPLASYQMQSDCSAWAGIPIKCHVWVLGYSFPPKLSSLSSDKQNLTIRRKTFLHSRNRISFSTTVFDGYPEGGRVKWPQELDGTKRRLMAKKDQGEKNIQLGFVADYSVYLAITQICC